jgi:hypothetical protein
MRAGSAPDDLAAPVDAAAEANKAIAATSIAARIAAIDRSLAPRHWDYQGSSTSHQRCLGSRRAGRVSITARRLLRSPQPPHPRVEARPTRSRDHTDPPRLRPSARKTSSNARLKGVVWRLAHAGEAFCLVEPRVHLSDRILARRDSRREERLKQAVAVDG